tara:strand:- start:210 stop:629 length:420 start_codon:yes stop_codon:yes gene_type:complete
LKGFILKDNLEMIAATAMLISVAKADKKFKESELKSIADIISDFFQINSEVEIDELINIANQKLNNATDIFEFGKILNEEWSYQDKIDFVCCMFEISLSDGDLYYLEEHMIKKISNILNVNHNDLIKSKIEIKKIFNQN